MAKNKVFDEVWGWFDAGRQYASKGAELFGGQRQMLAGRYYGTDGGFPSTNAHALNQLWLSPLWVPHRITIDRISVEVTTATATATPRLGIYGAASDGQPGALIIDAGTVDGSTTGIKEITPTGTLTIPAGLYFLAAVNQVAAATLRTIGSSPAAPVHATVGGGSTGANSYFLNTVAGALPATATWSVSSGAPRVMVRVV